MVLNLLQQNKRFPLLLGSWEALRGSSLRKVVQMDAGAPSILPDSINQLPLSHQWQTEDSASKAKISVCWPVHKAASQ